MDSSNGQKRKYSDIIGDGEDENTLFKQQNSEEVPTNPVRDLLKRTEREYTTVIVNNLPKNTNIKTINAFFALCGDIKSTKFIKKSQSAKLQFCNNKEMLSALTMNYKHFNNNPEANVISVEPYNDSTVWVTNYPKEYSYVDIKNLFENAVGENSVFEVRMPSLKFNSNKRFAYVDFLSNKHCTDAITIMNNKIIDGFKLIVKLNKKEYEQETERQATSTESVENMNERELYLTNLNAANKDKDIFDELRTKCGCSTESNDDHFEGPIKRTSSNSRVGFVLFRNKDCVSKIIQSSKQNNKKFYLKTKTNKIFYKKVESKGYLERVKFKKMLQLGTRFKDYASWISIFPLLEEKVAYLNKFQLQAYLETSVSGVKVLEVLLVTDYKGILVKLDSEASASKVRLKFDNSKGLKLNNVTYANDFVKCKTILELINAQNLSSDTTISTTVESDTRKKEQKVNLRDDSSLKSEPLAPKSNGLMSNNDFRSLFK